MYILFIAQSLFANSSRFTCNKWTVIILCKGGVIFTFYRYQKYAKAILRETKDENFHKQARKLQATLVPVRNYHRLTYLIADGGEM